jgi:hypothetical protein
MRMPASSTERSLADRLRTAAKFWRLAGREAFAVELETEVEALEAAQVDPDRGPLESEPEQAR